MAVLANAARSAYDLAFQISPIILNGGLAQKLPGGALPVIGLVGSLVNVGLSFLTNGIGLSDIGIRFVPLPGAQVVSNAVATYPFANQSVAANAIVAQPLAVSLEMIAPANSDFGYAAKLPTFTAMQASFAAHNALGGTYSIATPSYIYANCIMVALTDITPVSTRQQQTHWQFDFVQPLISMSAANNAMNALFQKLLNGAKTDGTNTSAITGLSAQGALSSGTSIYANVLQNFATALPGLP